MNFRFFGDSWFWTWAPEHSSFISEGLSKQGEYKCTLSLTKILLQNLGHSVETFCQPGYSFNQTCVRIKESKNLLPSARNPEVWVIWASSDLRPAHHTNNHIRPEWDLTDKEKFLEQYNEYMLWSLDNVNRSALEDVNYIFVGGQQSLPKKDVWDKITNRKPNMHLLSECILGTLMRTYQNSGFKDIARFYLEEEFVRIVDENPDKKLDHRLVEMMARDKAESSPENSNFQHISTRLMWPDTGHLGFNGHVLFVDYLLKYCEDNNLL